MLTFAPTMRHRIRLTNLFNRIRTNKLRGFSTRNFRELYCFGVTDHRQADIYISPQIPNSALLAEILRERYEIETVARNVGNPAPRHWLAFSTRFRVAHPALCTRVLLLTCLTLNHRITFEPQ